MDRQAEKDKTERGTGLGGRTREEIAKWNQMTALRFQTAGETSDIPGLPSGAVQRPSSSKTTFLSLKTFASHVYINESLGKDHPSCKSHGLRVKTTFFFIKFVRVVLIER